MYGKQFDRSAIFAALVALLWVGVLAQGSERVGVPRDESFYVVARLCRFVVCRSF